MGEVFVSQCPLYEVSVLPDIVPASLLMMMVVGCSCVRASRVSRCPPYCTLTDDLSDVLLYHFFVILYKYMKTVYGSQLHRTPFTRPEKAGAIFRAMTRHSPGISLPTMRQLTVLLKVAYGS